MRNDSDDKKIHMTYIFGKDLFKCLTEEIPFENFQIFFDIARFRIREVHDTLEKVAKAGLVFGNCSRTEPFQIAPDAVLLLYWEFAIGKTLQKVNYVNRCDKASVEFFTVDARDDTIRLTILLLSDRFAGDNEPTTILDF